MVTAPPSVSSSQDFSLPQIPELFLPNFLDVLLPPTPVKPSTKDQLAQGLTAWGTPLVKPPSNPMTTALQSTANRTLTTNGAATYNSTGSATLDAFQLAGEKKGRDLDLVLSKSWREDSEMTLRIIWNMRSIHDGKGDKEGFYRAFGWLYQKHPRTAISNLRFLVEPVCTHSNKKDTLPHGYWKDLLNILALETAGELTNDSGTFRLLHCRRQKYTYPRQRRRIKAGTRDSRILAAKKANETRKVRAKAIRAKRASHSAQRLGQKLRTPKYRALFVAVARLFAERLVTDLKLLNEADQLPQDADRISFLKQLSLAGKWAPTPGLSHDRVTNISTAIALLIRDSQVFAFPSVLSDPQSTLTSRERFAILRSVYQRWVLTPLRKACSVTETFMASNRWKAIQYNRVSSQCMHLHKDLFFKRDQDGFTRYLTRLEEGKTTISGATLMPHELVAQVARAEMTDYRPPSDASDAKAALRERKVELMKTRGRVAEGQWKTLIQNLRQAGTIENSIAICDVSGSMGSIFSKLDKNTVQPIFPSVALSLVLAQLAKPPFSNGFITFSATPQFVTLDPEMSLGDTIKEMARADWGNNTDFNAVFLKLILPLAIENKVKQEDMIKRLFVFSDMQFDSAQGLGYNGDWGWANPATSAQGEWSDCGWGSPATTQGDWTTNHDAVEEAFKAAGYEVPQIVYWDLANYGTVPVLAEKKGVALMNGVSPAMMKAFMGEEEQKQEQMGTGEDGWEEVRDDGEINTVEAEVEWHEQFTPVNIMKKVLGMKSFSGLTVLRD